MVQNETSRDAPSQPTSVPWRGMPTDIAMVGTKERRLGARVIQQQGIWMFVYLKKAFSTYSQ
jgi:hypothetical protein